jgi:hydroxymethylpyrimidine kinase/phosphomethylpyrimidine kinase/thiamine-phosphate diphosphorylase
MKQVLIISGLEANGFAGLLKDVQVCASLRIQPQAIATTLTAQSATKLLDVQSADCQLVAQQLESLIIVPAVIKIGLVPNRAIAEVIAAWLTNLPKQPFIVLDPVLSSSKGGVFFENTAHQNHFNALLPFVSLLTPNLLELRDLVGTTSKHQTDLELIESFYEQNDSFKGNVLVTGGHHASALHLQSESDYLQSHVETVTDKLYERQLYHRVSISSWQQEKISSDMRGTGCFLSTAIACAISRGYRLYDAITLANAKLNKELNGQHNKILEKQSTVKSRWPTDIKYFPHVTHGSQNAPVLRNHRFPTMDEPAGLYPIVDSAQWVERLAIAGIRTIQLRIKNSASNTDQQKIENEISSAVATAQKHNLQLFINDHWQLAVKHNAYGVHLGQEDLDTADIEAIQSAGLRLGISTHGDFELLRALQIRPSYLAVGAIYPTQTKDMTGKIQGLQRLTRYCNMITDTPIVAIGGINISNVTDVLGAKPDFVAVVSAITKAKDPEHALNELQKYFSSKR